MTWTLENSTPVTDLNLVAHEYKHSTGAHLVHLECDDPNNLFAISFITEPDSDTGLPHILEHTVLTGSEKYPTRDPFFSMLKRSVASFLNAFTSSSETFYPFSSMVEKDFYNLMSVYLDACFFPNIKELNFMQEGVRVEYNEKGELEFKGVVFNEMKGSMTDVSSLTYRRITKHLFPTTTYKYNSGGEPVEIIKITHQDLLNFHRKFYVPANAFFVVYGNFPINPTLELIHNEALSKFTNSGEFCQIPREIRRNQSIMIEETFADDNLSNNSVAVSAFLLCDIDEKDKISLMLLNQLLIGSDASPLKKALIDCNLGLRLAPASGYHDDVKTTFASYGLLGVNNDNRDQVTKIIDDTFLTLSQSGFDRDHIEGVINRFEFDNREVADHGYPYPITLLFRFLPTFMHTFSLQGLKLLDYINQIRLEIDRDQSYFQNLIVKYFVENLNRVNLLIKPDNQKKNEEDQYFAEILKAIDQRLSTEEKRSIAQKSEELKRLQSTEEDLSCLPNLEVADVSSQEKSTDFNQILAQNGEFLTFIQPTNGVFYMTLFFDLTNLPINQIKLLPFYCELLGSIDLTSKNFVQLSRDIESFTGGIDFSIKLLPNIDNPNDFRIYLDGSCKCLYRFIDKMLSIFQSILIETIFDNQERISQVLKQFASRLENSINRNGHVYATSSATSSLSVLGAYSEELSGVSMVKNAKKISKLQGDELKEFCHSLIELHKSITSSGQKSMIVYDNNAPNDLVEKFSSFISNFSFSSSSTSPSPLPLTNSHKSWTITSPVGYTADVALAHNYTEKSSPLLFVLSKIIGSSFLHNEIREKGGAYGGYMKFNVNTGVISMQSYRDPSPFNSFKIYDQILEWINDGNINEKSLKEGILSAIRDVDVVRSPYDRAYYEFTCFLSGKDLRKRQEFRLGVLNATVEKLIDVGNQILTGGQKSRAFIGGNDLFEKVKQEIQEQWSVDSLQ
ncbi:hypothetical protein RCL1_001319 [Eukaryota sp. TZLM3-RCL]